MPETFRGRPFLTFLDLIEIRFLDQFRKRGVSWRALRIAVKKARSLLNHGHPFATSRFRTDGRSILISLSDKIGDKMLLNLVNDQYEFEKIISEYLHGGMEFDNNDEPSRWYPIPNKHTVVIDPRRQFGAPILSRNSIPTRTLAQSYSALQSYDAVANWYEIDAELVKDAVGYETQLAA